MGLKIQNVKDVAFLEYGSVVEGFDFTEFVDVLEKTTEAPNHVIYVASDKNLEEMAVAKELQSNCYGGFPIQVGYCNGTNTKLNCLEYHKAARSILRLRMRCFLSRAFRMFLLEV